MISMLWKTLLVNMRCLPFQHSIRFPIIVSANVNLRGLKGKIVLQHTDFGSVRIGFHNVGIFDKRKSPSILDISGTWEVKGRCSIGHGSKVCVEEGATLVTGERFQISAEAQIICNKRIVFGNDVLVSWDTLFMDTDYHSIFDSEGKKINPDEEIHIGDRVWFGCRSIVLKGAKVGNDTVIAANSCVTKDITEHENVIMGGSPMRVMRENISWAI